MSKQNRKRKSSCNNVESDISAPKNKFKTFDEKARAEEENLSSILFGGPSSFLKSLEEASTETDLINNVDSGLGEEDSDVDVVERKPVWTDDEDDGIDVGQAVDSQNRRLPNGGVNSRTNNYYMLLKNKFVNSYGTPNWATLKSRPHNEDSDVIQTTGFVKDYVGENLPEGTIEFKKVKHLNSETYSEGPSINSVEFNRASSVALIAGSAGIVSFYAVDGKSNDKLHSVAFQKFPVLCARFLQCGNEAVLGSHHPYIFSYDLLAAKEIRIQLPAGMKNLQNFVISPDKNLIAAAGNYGEVHLLSSMSKERVTLLKQETDVTALAFDCNSKLLFGHSVTGEVTVWDMNMRRVIHRWADHGCVNGTRLSMSSSNQFLATGSAEGVVNIYRVEDVLRHKTPAPQKSLFNLATKITDLKFNTSSEILAFSSVEIPNSVKLYHVGSQTVFSNFPNFSTKFGNINVLNFSPNTGYFALGNKKSSVALYRLKHFKNY